MNILLLAILFLGWIAAVIFFYVNRVWLLFYIAGAIGTTYWLVLFARFIFPIELPLAQSVAQAVYVISNAIGVPTRIFRNAPGVLLVLVIAQRVGWTVLN